MKRILCLTDFSDNAYNGILYANDLAKKFSSRLIFMHTYELEMEVRVKELTHPTLLAHNDTQSRDKLSRICMDLKRQDRYGTVSYDYIVKKGGVSQNLNKINQEQNIDLVVFSVEGELNPHDNYYRSVVSELSQSTKCPLIAIPTGVKYRNIENIVFAFDIENIDIFPKQSIAFAKLFNAHVTVFSCVQEIDERKTKELYFKFNALKHETGYDKISFDIRTGENIMNPLEKFIIEKKADVIILENHKKNLYKRLYEGSFIRQFVFLSKVPILVIRSQEEYVRYSMH